MTLCGVHGLVRAKNAGIVSDSPFAVVILLGHHLDLGAECSCILILWPHLNVAEGKAEFVFYGVFL